MEGVVLNREGILGLYLSQKGSGFQTLSGTTHTQTWVKFPLTGRGPSQRIILSMKNFG